MIDKLADFPQNADIQRMIDKINELVEVVNKPVAKVVEQKVAPTVAKKAPVKKTTK